MIPVIASYLLALLSIPLVLCYHLLPAVFSGLAVHILTMRLARRLPTRLGRRAHQMALGFIVICIILAMAGIAFWIWSFIRSESGISGLLTAIAETLDKVQRSLPQSVANLVPNTMEEVRVKAVNLLREHRHRISVVGMEGVRFLAHVLIGMVIGAMTALHRFSGSAEQPPLAGALHLRLERLVDAFDKVVFAQVKISALNTVLTALYLLGILPLFGVHVPMRGVLVILTFVVGLLPVFGNLISNSVIVLISLGVSPAVGVASLAFLVIIHKLEYFTNAKIVGGEVHASAWELLCAMIAMEAVFGVVGLVAAPVVYAWLKAEVEAGVTPAMNMDKGGIA